MGPDMAGAGRRRRIPTAAAVALALITGISAAVSLNTERVAATAPGANGVLVFQNWVGTNVQVYTIGVDGSNATNVSSNSFHDFGPVWSPDGRRIAFASDREGAPGLRDIHVMNADGSEVRRVTNGPGDNVDPAWSPDSASIAFVSYRDGNPELYLVQADGTGEVRLTNSPGGGYDSRFLARREVHRLLECSGRQAADLSDDHDSGPHGDGPGALRLVPVHAKLVS